MSSEGTSLDLLSTGTVRICLPRSFVLMRCCVLYWVTKILTGPY